MVCKLSLATACCNIDSPFSFSDTKFQTKIIHMDPLSRTELVDSMGSFSSNSFTNCPQKTVFFIKKYQVDLILFTNHCAHTYHNINISPPNKLTPRMTQGALVVLLGHDGCGGERRHFCLIFVRRELTFLEVRGIRILSRGTRHIAAAPLSSVVGAPITGGA
jgi:hypothetical protein